VEVIVKLILVYFFATRCMIRLRFDGRSTEVIKVTVK